MKRTVDEHLINALCWLEWPRIMKVVNDPELWPTKGDITMADMVDTLRNLMRKARANPNVTTGTRGFMVTYYEEEDSFDVAWQLTSWTTMFSDDKG